MTPTADTALPRPDPRPIVFIGTSPLVLCHALSRVLRGECVRILDERTVPGGAWMTADVLGCSNVEAAVHLIENRSDVHRALAGLGVPLHPAHGRIGALVGDVTIPLAFSRVLAFFGVAMKSLARGDRGRAQTALRGLGRAMRECRTPFLYPRGGASELTCRLLQHLASHGVTPEYGVTVLEATRISSNECLIVTSAGPIEARRVAIASRAHCRLRRDGAPLELEIQEAGLQCIAIRVVGPAPPFEYLEFHGRAMLRRARNLSAMMRPSLPPAEHVISVQLRWSDPRATTSSERCDAQARSVIHLLRRRGLLAPEAQLVAAWSAHFHMRTIPDRLMHQLALTEADWILPIRTTDFGEELASSLKRLQLDRRSASDAMCRAPRNRA